MANKSYVFKGMAKNDAICISLGNPKIGNVPNTSFPRGVTCNPDAPCNQKGCYMGHREKMYPTMIEVYRKNLRIYQESPAEYIGQLRTFLWDAKPKLFRYFVDGDMPDIWYLVSMSNTARVFPDTIFTAYTKRYDWVAYFKRNHVIPSNLIILASAWPKFELPTAVSSEYRVVWMDNGKEDRIPADAIRCPAKCSSCLACYNPKETRDISIKYHR